MAAEETGRINPLDQNFFYNSMLAKALVQLLPPNGKYLTIFTAKNLIT